MTALPFVKLHGLRNDYVYLDLFEDDVRSALGPLDLDAIGDRPDGTPGGPLADLARAISDRHGGVGGDGLILVGPSESADVRMVMLNADGSRSEMCGNGLRAAALLVAPRLGHELLFETDAGQLATVVQSIDGTVAMVTTDLGPPALEPADIPTTLGGGPPLIRVPLDVNGTTVEATCVGMGNPHCVLFVDDVESAPVETFGPAIETHPAFPARTNVEFVATVDGGLAQRTWERGTGETLACGTGAAAVCVAAHLAGLTGREVRIDLRGGTALLAWGDDDRVRLTGPAEEVMRGHYHVQ